MPAIFNDLLEFKSEIELDALLEKMDKGLAIKLLEIALDTCTDRFSLIENHVIYECLTKLKQNYGPNTGNGELQQGERTNSL